MATELEHSIASDQPIAERYAAMLDLGRLIPCVPGGSVVEVIGPTTAKAEIKVKMGALSMTFTGTVEVIQQDDAAHRFTMTVKSREAGGQGHANAEVTFALADGGGTVSTRAQITGKAASMGEGVVVAVLDGLIGEFVRNVSAI